MRLYLTPLHLPLLFHCAGGLFIYVSIFIHLGLCHAVPVIYRTVFQSTLGTIQLLIWASSELLLLLVIFQPFILTTCNTHHLCTFSHPLLPLPDCLSITKGKQPQNVYRASIGALLNQHGGLAALLKTSGFLQHSWRILIWCLLCTPQGPWYQQW